MYLSESLAFLGLALFVQLIGLLSVALARVSERSAAQALCQQFFVVCLLMVGGISVLAIHLGADSWLICATMLPLMAVGATLDLQRSPECSSF